jgi:hypothetical protein
MSSRKELTIGERFRSSFIGKGVKKAVTNRRSMQIRDKILNRVLSDDQEHVKRFAQYLTGGTIDNKDITQLPEGVRQDVIASHRMGEYPDREQKIYKTQKEIAAEEARIQKDLKSGKITFEESQKQWNHLIHGEGGLKINPTYNPESNLLSTYASKGVYNLDGNLKTKISNRTSGSIGHGQFRKNKDGSYTLTDRWDVDPADQATDLRKEDRVYIPWKSKRHPDLREGGRFAARAYDLSKFLGINKDLNYNVNFTAQEVEGRKQELSIRKQNASGL